MRIFYLLGLILFCCTELMSQDGSERARFYIGASYGTSVAIGNFEDKNPDNSDAGFAKNGTKIDVYGGFFLPNEKLTLTGVLRFQTFNTDIGNVLSHSGARTCDDYCFAHDLINFI